MKGLLLALLGVLICVATISVASVLIMTLMWWMFRHNLDFEDLINTEEWEDKQ